MCKKLLQPALFLATGIVMVLASFIAFPGQVPIAHAAAKPFCQSGTKFDGMSLANQYFVPLWQDADINGGVPSFTRTFQVTTTRQASAQLSAQLQGNANFVFEQAQITLGVQVSGSQTVQHGETTQFSIAPNTAIHVYRGVPVDQITTQTVDMSATCTVLSKSYGFFEAPEAPQWRICVNPYINGREAESADCQSMQSQLNRPAFPSDPVQVSG